MPVDNLLADTDIVRALGGAYTAHSADLAAISARSGALPAPDLGPVGVHFLAAFADAVSDHSAAVAALGDAAATAAGAANGNAASYDAASRRAGALLRA